MTRSHAGLESRPAHAEHRYPQLAALLNAFSQLHDGPSRFDFVFIGGTGRAFQVRVDRSSVALGAGSLTAVEAPIPLGLTPRQLDVVSLMSVGASYAEIAQLLHVSLSTVTTHAEHVFTKLGTKNRTEVVVQALQRGAVRLPLPAAPRVDTETLLGGLDAAVRGAHRSATSADPTTAVELTVTVPSNPIRIGCLYPVGHSEGEDMLLGAQLAVEEINAAGGVHDRPLELVTMQVDITSIDAIQHGTETILDDNVDALSFGYADPRESLPQLLSAWAEAGVPVLHSLTSQLACEIVADGNGRYNNIFQICPGDNFYGDEFLRFAGGLLSTSALRGSGRDILMLTDDAQMVEFYPSLARQAARLGFDLTLAPARGEADAIAAAQRVSSDAPAIVFLACFRPATTKAFMRQFLARPSASFIYTLWAPGTSDFRHDLHEFEGLVWSTTTGRYEDALGRGFESRFEQRFGRPVFGTSASIQYDGIGIFADSWRRTGQPGSYRSTSAEMRNIIHRGVNGSYFFGAGYQRPLAYGIESHDASLSQAHLVYQIQDGMNRIISPAPYALSSYRPQPWLRPALAA